MSSSYYLGLFIHVGMGRLSSRWQVTMLSEAEDGVKLEACVLFFYYTYWMLLDVSAVLSISLSDVVRPYVQNCF